MISRREWAWAFYDWANSAFATSVMAGFFPVFFKQYWNEAPAHVSTLRLAAANSLAGIAIALFAPFLGTWADLSYGKKKFFIFFAFCAIISTLALSFVARGDWVMAFIFYCVASFGFFAGNIFYDSFLPVIVTRKNLDKISNLGMAMGYLGGGLLFVLHVFWVKYPSFFGFSSAQIAIKSAFASVGIWWGVFALPVFLFVHEPEKVHDTVKIASVFRELFKTAVEIFQAKHIFYFLLAYWLYIDGLDTMVRMAVDYGLSIGLKSEHLLSALILTQFVGFPAGIAYIFLTRKIGVKYGILAGILVYIFICIWGATIQTSEEFFILAGMVGLVQGGVQALSRSYFARLIPKEKTAEYFGFYNMLGKFAVIFGPLLMALSGYFAVRFLDDPSIGPRISIVSIAILFISGALILRSLPDPDKLK